MIRCIPLLEAGWTLAGEAAWRSSLEETGTYDAQRMRTGGEAQDLAHVLWQHLPTPGVVSVQVALLSEALYMPQLWLVNMVNGAGHAATLLHVL